jgi:hypothetical protein
MVELIPDDDHQFSELMTKIDLELARNGRDISARPMEALGVLSTNYGIPLPITEPPENAKHESAKHWPTSSRVYQWYEMRYGDRLKVDMSPGRMVIFVEEDLWVLYFPRIFGTIKFFVSQSIESNRVQYDQNPACFNVLDAIRDMTLGRRNALPNNEAVHVFEKFMLGFRAISLLEGTMTHKLTSIRQ